MKLVGKGSQYAMIALDKNGDYLDGAQNYKVNIPANVPANKFWSLVVYDPQTRSELQTDQPFPSINSLRNQDLKKNTDGSIETSTSALKRLMALKQTGSRRFLVKAGSRTSPLWPS